MIPRNSCRVVNTLPTSTTNMTGLPIILRGFSFLNESTIARLTICAFQIAFFLGLLVILFGACCWTSPFQNVLPLECADQSALWSGCDLSQPSLTGVLARVGRQDAADQSGDRSPHSNLRKSSPPASASVPLLVQGSTPGKTSTLPRSQLRSPITS